MLIINKTENTLPISITDTSTIELQANGGTIELLQYYSRSEVATSTDLANKIMDEDVVVSDGTEELTREKGLDLVKNRLSTVAVTEQPEPHPFAAPLFRTKKDATSAKETVAKNDNEAIDYKLLQELYVSGGTIIVKNAEFGDYVTAEVYDKDSVIPEQYRAALCEDWPCVSEYILKSWIEYEGNTYTIHRVDTRPLNAKITAGLYLRVTYYAIDAGETREVLVNYDLTKKL